MTAVALALLAALCFAAATLLQQRAATAPAAPSGRTAVVRLVGHLLRSPKWLLGAAVGLAGLGLNALALRVGQVVVVQPLLASGLVFTLALDALVARALPPAQEVVAAAGVAAGLAIFLLAARPAAGTPTGSDLVLAVAGLAVLALAAGARLWTRRPAARHPGLLLGAAAGTAFGVTGALLKQVVDTPPAHLPVSWPPYALVVLGVLGVALAQQAYQAGSLEECLPAMTVAEPVVAVAVGALGFGEALAGSAPAHLAQLAGLVLMTAGVVHLAALQSPPAAVRPSKDTEWLPRGG